MPDTPPASPKDRYPVERSGTATMRPRARLISLIGEDLISDEPVAVVELVKNAYDADADRVTIRFEGDDPNAPERVVVEDDGDGMTLDTVLGAWFEPGTVAKRVRKSSDRGRVYQGAKGIGRFAAARLAELLFMETVARGEKEGTVALVDWGAFDEDSYLDAVTVDYEVRPIGDLDHGTRLTLETLRKGWDDDDYEALHSRLSRLISPFEDVKDFEIELVVPAHPELSGPVEPPEVVLKPIYSLEGHLDRRGHFTGVFKHQGETVREYAGEKLGKEGENPLCGPFQVEIRVWDRDRDSLQPIAERHDQTITDVRRVLNNYSGVSIYRDGFRVYPYGQKGNDWLGLDNRSRQNPSMHLANNQVIAAVQISRDANPELRDRSTREGMVLNTEHKALERWFKEVLALLERERYEIRPRQDADTIVDPIFEVFDIGGTFDFAQAELGRDHPVTKEISQTQKRLREGVERVQNVYSRLLMSAGLGHMVDIVIHEIGAPLGKINRKLTLLEKRLGDRLSDADMKAVSPLVQDVKTWLEQIHALRGRLDPQTPDKRGRATSFSVEDEVRDTFELFDALMQKQGVETLVELPDGPIQVRMSRAVLGQVLANLTDNSLYWIRESKGSGAGGRIHVRVESLDGGFRILFSDDGPGVDERDRPLIFDSYFTRKANGIGLGLYIARLVVEPYGKISYRDDCALPGACFEIAFEKSVGR
ncbi:MAG TPA: sensor histidine kinase [Bacteroidetes bacterium]|nr:sensor histidine kinase [Bacteroidota bacterium]